MVIIVRIAYLIPHLMITKPSPVTLPDAELTAFDVLSFGTLQTPSKPTRFGFQLDMNAQPGLGQVVFGLIQSNGDRSQKGRIGFGVRIDLERGEIWDVVNDSGLVGWVQESLSPSDSKDFEPLLLSLEIERVGSALLPKLQIGGEEWLYPAVRSVDGIELTAFAGTTVRSSVQGLSGDHVFTKPSLWTEEPLV
jgi:hypothetical protein